MTERKYWVEAILGETSPEQRGYLATCLFDDDELPDGDNGVGQLIIHREVVRNLGGSHLEWYYDLLDAYDVSYDLTRTDTTASTGVVEGDLGSVAEELYLTEDYV